MNSALIVALIVFYASAGCTKRGTAYCEAHPDACGIDASPPGDEAPTACTSSAQCIAPTTVCDVTDGVCVACTPQEAAACDGATPVCGDDRACRACAAHPECAASNACLPDGSCAIAADVAYVAPTGTGTTCTQAEPCGTVAAALATDRPYVKLAAGLTKDSQVTTIDGRVVTLLGDPGAILDRDGDGPILVVRSTGADVQIVGLRITGASGVAGANGIELQPNGGAPKLTLHRATIDSNQGIGISATGGTLTVTQSSISGNTGGGISATGGTLTARQSTISGNTGGGISITNAQFDLENNIIASNGGPATGFGGVRIDQVGAGTRRFEFNTVTNNNGAAGTTTGVVCTLVTQPITFSNNIVFDNQIGAARTQVGGVNCSWTYSNIGPDGVAGVGNINMDPLFVNPAQNNFHLTSASPAKDAADPAATLAVDIDGDARPQGVARDMGADELAP